MKKIRKCMAFITTVALLIQTSLCYADTFPLFPSNSCTVQENAEIDENIILDANIIKATELLKELFDFNYNREIDRIKDTIAEKGYDYELTMQSVTETGNPFEGVDVVKVIAALCTIMEHTDTAISEVELIRTYYKEYNIKEYIPEKVQAYRELEDGKYEADGHTYITTPQKINTYAKRGNYYEKSGTKYIELEERTILCADITMIVCEGAELFQPLSLPNSCMEEYNERLYRILNLSRMNVEDLYQSIFVKDIYSIELLSEDEQQALTEALEKVEGNRKILLTTAAMLIERIPYEWGGKANAPGYDSRWWSYNEESKKQKGLDCSGYVQWCFMTAGYKEDIYHDLVSTGSILKATEDIVKEDLKAGDLGLLHDGSERVNHVGIYLGNDYWIHCSSTRNTVSVSKCSFKLFKRVKGIDTASLNPYMVTLPEKTITYTNDDVILLAKLICNEARGEGLNTWIAVGEVVVNRVKSDLFPNTLKEVIYQESKEGIKQFSDNERIEGMEPTTEILRAAKGVLEGTMKIFDDESVLFFRNPGNMDNNEDWGPFPFVLRIGPVCFYRKMPNS